MRSKPDSFRSLGFVLTLLVAVATAAAQTASPPDPAAPTGDNLKTPTDWRVRLDEPDPDVVIGDDQATAGIWFVSMVPGWHITTGPRAIFWHPGLHAKGDWRAETTIHLFDPGERKEAFGLFFGGRDLESDSIAYDYFVLRNSGEYLIKRRRGGETEVIRDWTPHDSIVTFGPESESSVENVLAVEVADDSVRFSVNGVEVTSLPRADVTTDGFVGLRLNHHLNVHVSDLSVTSSG